jgi:small subunit ribosomal protein S17
MEKKTKQKIRMGRVVSARMDKSVVVIVERLKKHPRVGKIIRQRKKFVAHDAQNECQENDIVRIGETRPLSKTKRWTLLGIVERAKIK